MSSADTEEMAGTGMFDYFNSRVNGQIQNTFTLWARSSTSSTEVSETKLILYKPRA